jgi:hypothetical protein
VALIRDVTVASSVVVTGFDVECGWSILLQSYKSNKIVSASNT